MQARINMWLLAIQSVPFENGSYLIVVPSLNLCWRPTFRIASASNKCISLNSHVVFLRYERCKCVLLILFSGL